MQVKPMRANPGGEIEAGNVVGRDRLIKEIWNALHVQSVVMVAERRIGKTTVVKKMRSGPPAGLRLIYNDVEGLSTPLEFVEAVARDVESLLPAVRQAGSKFRRMLGHLGGIEIGGVLKLPPQMSPNWKDLLRATVEDLLDHCPDSFHVFVWDEIPLMLDKIRSSAGEQVAMDVLDVLRGLRQKHSRLRMIYTGSIGLHHVLSGLREAGHANAPTNDMRTIEVTPLDRDDGRMLAQALLLGEELQCSEPEETADATAEEVDDIPYYIHQVVARMRAVGNEASAALARSIVRKALVDAQDTWNLAHYRDRLDGRYGPDRLTLVLAVLDAVGAAGEPLAFDDLGHRVRSTVPREKARSDFVRAVIDGDDEKLRKLLTSLERDHYLCRDPDKGHYRFRFSLIQRWWIMKRGGA